MERSKTIDRMTSVVFWMLKLMCEVLICWYLSLVLEYPASKIFCVVQGVAALYSVITLKKSDLE